MDGNDPNKIDHDRFVTLSAYTQCHSSHQQQRECNTDMARFRQIVTVQDSNAPPKSNPRRPRSGGG